MGALLSSLDWMPICLLLPNYGSIAQIISFLASHVPLRASCAALQSKNDFLLGMSNFCDTQLHIDLLSGVQWDLLPMQSVSWTVCPISCVAHTEGCCDVCTDRIKHARSIFDSFPGLGTD